MKKILTFFVRIILSAGLVAFVLKKIDIPAAWNIVQKSNITLLILSFLLLNLLIYFSLYRWNTLLNGLRLKFKFSKLLISFSGGNFFNLFLPTTVGGDVVKGMHLASHSKRKYAVAASVIIDRLSGYAALNLVALIAFLFSFSYLNDRAILLSVCILTSCMFIILAVMFNKRGYNIVWCVFGKAAFFKKLQNVHRLIFYLRSRPKEMAKILIISLFIQLGLGVTHYLIACSVGVQKSIVYFLVLVPILMAITTLPITIGGLGLRDMSAVFLFAKIGISKEIAIVISLLFFVFVVINGIIGGFIYVFGLHPGWLQHHKTHSTVRT